MTTQLFQIHNERTAAESRSWNANPITCWTRQEFSPSDLYPFFIFRIFFFCNALFFVSFAFATHLVAIPSNTSIFSWYVSELPIEIGLSS